MVYCSQVDVAGVQFFSWFGIILVCNWSCVLFMDGGPEYEKIFRKAGLALGGGAAWGVGRRCLDLCVPVLQYRGADD